MKHPNLISKNSTQHICISCSISLSKCHTGRATCVPFWWKPLTMTMPTTMTSDQRRHLLERCWAPAPDSWRQWCGRRRTPRWHECRAECSVTIRCVENYADVVVGVADAGGVGWVEVELVVGNYAIAGRWVSGIEVRAECACGRRRSGRTCWSRCRRSLGTIGYREMKC